MYFETLRSPDEDLCPLGTVLSVSEAAQLTEHNASGLREESEGADAVRLDGFAFKILNCLEEAGQISVDDLAFAWASDTDVQPYDSAEDFDPPLISLEDLLNEREEDEDESGDSLFR